MELFCIYAKSLSLLRARGASWNLYVVKNIVENGPLAHITADLFSHYKARRI